MIAAQPGIGDDPAAALASRRRMIDTTRAHSARRYNYWLGGKDHFAADRESGDRIAAAFPATRTAAIENRRFLRRAVAFLARAGIRQFLDIGTGLPTADNTHQVAQGIAADARIVYVDNDPLIMTHARALLTSPYPGSTAYVQADLRHPETILADPGLTATIDLHKPVGLLIIAVLHFVEDADDPFGLVARLVQALPAGSFVAISHATFDGLPAATVARLDAAAGAGDGPFRARTRDEVARFLTGLTLVEPSLVPVVDWRPEQDPKPEAAASDAPVYGAVGRKP